MKNASTGKYLVSKLNLKMKNSRTKLADAFKNDPVDLKIRGPLVALINVLS